MYHLPSRMGNMFVEECNVCKISKTIVLTNHDIIWTMIWNVRWTTVKFARYSSCRANSTKLDDIHTLQKIDCEDNTVTAEPLPYGQPQMFVLAKEKSRVDPDQECLNAEAPSLITSCEYVPVRRLNLMKIRVSLSRETHTTRTFQQSLWWWHCIR